MRIFALMDRALLSDALLKLPLYDSRSSDSWEYANYYKAGKVIFM